MTPIEVCADWEGLGGPQRLGWLHAWNKGAICIFRPIVTAHSV
jgi:hypothetical protein